MHPAVAAALQAGESVVALESTLLSHGLPWPLNLETLRAADAAVREEGAVPAVVGVWEGRPTVGLNASQTEALARGPAVLRASRRDLGVAVAQRLTATTTVAASLGLAHLAGIRVLAAGGIGGAHPGSDQSFDVSADLLELSRTPVAVVCAGAKSILDLSRTLELLESYGVPVVGYGTPEFPAYYLRDSGQPVSARVDTPRQAAELLGAHWGLRGTGVVLALPVAADAALRPDDFAHGLLDVERQAAVGQVRGKDLTPYLLTRLAQLTGGKTLRAIQALVPANARLAAQVARQLQEVG
jgi:pseudouridine-5'-phosphate glycosidase